MSYFSGASSGAAIGSVVTGATEGSILFAGVGGILEEDNSALFWNDGKDLLRLVTTTDDLTEPAVKFSFAGYDGAYYTTGLHIAATGASSYFPYAIKMTNAGYSKTGSLRMGDEHGIAFGGGDNSGTRFLFGDQSVTHARISNISTHPSLTVWTNSTTRVPVEINLAASQTANALEVKNSGGTTIAKIDKDGHLVWATNCAVFSDTVSSYLDGSGSVVLRVAEITTLQVDNNATAGNTRLLIYDVDNGQMERVSVGAADSGGSGYKVLRIPN